MPTIEGAKRRWMNRRPPQTGDIIAMSCPADTHPRPWRVIHTADSKPHPRHGRLCPVVTIRPLDAGLDMDASRTGEDVHIGLGGLTWLQLDEHYPVCCRCGELMPCSHIVTERRVSAAMERMESYSAPGVCPACGEAVSSRQRSRTFAENLVVPGGPAVTFHLRRRCAWSAEDYADRVAEQVGGRG